MDGQRSVSIWEKFDPRLIHADQTPADPNQEPNGDTPRRSRWRGFRWRALDAVATATWAYGLGRLLVGDFDRWIAGSISPTVARLLDFRLFAFLAFGSMVLLVFRDKKYLWAAVYILAFPLIFIAWKIPRFLYKRQSWTLAVGLLHVATVSVQGFRFGFISFAVAAVSALLITVSSGIVLQGVGVAALSILWITVLAKALRNAVVPARFVRAQERILARLLRSDSFWNLVAVDEKLRDPSVVKLDANQANQVMTKAGAGLITYRASQFWAYRLDEYRRSGASILFSAFSIVALIFQAVFTFTLINGAVYDVAPDQYQVAGDGSPSVPIFAYYSFASLFVNEVSAISPRGGVAATVHMAAGFSTAVLLFILIVTLIFGYKQSRTDLAATESIAEMRRRADEFATRLGQEYDLSVEQLLRRFTELQWDVFGVLTFLAKNIPEDPLARSHESREGAREAGGTTS